MPLLTSVLSSKYLYIALAFIGIVIYFEFKIINLELKINDITSQNNKIERLKDEYKALSTQLEKDLDNSLKISRSNVLELERIKKNQVTILELEKIKEQSYVNRIIKLRDLILELSKTPTLKNPRDIVVKNCIIKESVDEDLNSIGW